MRHLFMMSAFGLLAAIAVGCGSGSSSTPVKPPPGSGAVADNKHSGWWCDEHGIPHEGVPVGEIKRGWTGKGNAKKEAMIAEAVRRGYSPADDNEADAIALFTLKAGE